MVTSTRYSTDRHDQSTHLIGVSVNSTSRVVEVVLRESERRFRTIFNDTFQFIGLLITEGMVLKANQTVLNFTKLQPQDVVRRLYWEIWWTLLGNLQHLEYLFFSSPVVIYICKSSEYFASKFMNENVLAITGYQGWETVEYPGFWASYFYSVLESFYRVSNVDHRLATRLAMAIVKKCKDIYKGKIFSQLHRDLIQSLLLFSYEIINNKLR
ncbi:hypothetical protein [Nostoc punctiforme]|uniref:Uncharacterized protein n=1 Tax=Nostoc punctiforme (strain ATCC 29133 / PCC 73102) TaxID=63737 RepID=B2IVQ7_NOSP7|nr:hypothetical protein [Nostoc punctiforme]ACC82870.1 hypothetical protein Npun_R4504 [Nostoc punctiforme PCC 73102]